MPPACRRRPSELAVDVLDVVWDSQERFLRGFEWRTHSAPNCKHPLSAPKTQNTEWENAHGGPNDVFVIRT